MQINNKGENEFQYCTDLCSLSISSVLTIKSCGYHKCGGETHNEGSLVPNNFCVDAYYATYPYILAILYDAKFDNATFGEELVLVCPNAKYPTLIKITFEFKKLKLVLNFIEKVARKLGFPKDAIDKTVKLEVINENHECRLDKGDFFNIKIPDMHELCPASFFSLYPFIYLYARNSSIKFSRSEDSKVSFICPDPDTNIVYNFTSKVLSTASLEKKSKTGSSKSYIPDLSKYKVLIENDVECKISSWKRKEVALNKIVPENLCPFVFNIAIPYIVTYLQGGYFKWRKNINDVGVQCPNPEGGVEFEVKREPENNKKIFLTIKKVRGCCSYSHNEGQVYAFDFDQNICIHLFVRAFPFILLLESSSAKYNEGISLLCPFSKMNAKYKLVRNDPDIQ